MGSRTPYIRDKNTGQIKYASESETSKLDRDFGNQLAYFKRNYDRLMGNEGKSAAPRPSLRPWPNEAEAYYNLYYMGHRTHDR